MGIFSRFTTWRNRFRRRSLCEESSRDTSLLPRAMLCILEEIIAWENPFLSLGFVAFVNVIFLIFIQMDITFTEMAFIVGMIYICLDGIETWLRCKHRTSCLEKLVQCEHVRLQNALNHTVRWLGRQKNDFLAMRETNPTKAFLVANIILGIIFVVGKTIRAVLLLYMVTMLTILYPVYGPYIHRFVKKVHQASDSDAELESLIPELSEHNIQELNIETDSVNTRHSVEPWLPEGSPGRELSDSDDESRSSAGSLPGGNEACLEARDSDSSEDEYLLKSEEDQLLTTVKVLPPGDMCGGDTVSKLWSLGSALSHLVHRPQPKKAHNAQLTTPTPDSSDDFEFVDQSDL